MTFSTCPDCMAVNDFLAFKIGKGQLRPHVSSSMSNAMLMLSPKFLESSRFTLPHDLARRALPMS